MDVKPFFGLHQFLVEKTGLCGREDPALSAVRPPVNITFLEMTLGLKRLPTPDIHFIPFLIIKWVKSSY